MTIETKDEMIETTARDRNLMDSLNRRLSRLAPLVTSKELNAEIEKRLGAFLRVCGVSLKVLSGRFHRLDSRKYSKEEIRLPLRNSDGEATLKLNFTLRTLSRDARNQIISALTTLLDDLYALRTPDSGDAYRGAAGPAAARNILYLSEVDLRITRCSEAVEGNLGIKPGMRMLEDITPEEGRRQLQTLLDNTGKTGSRVRRRMTIHRGMSGKLDATIEVVGRNDGEIICELSEVSTPDIQERGYVPPQMPERLVHRLRNPLTTIMSCCSQLLESPQSQIDSTDETLIKWISTGADSLNAIINRYLQLYGEVTCSPRKLKLADVLSAVVSENEARYDNRVIVTDTDTDVEILADVYLLKQIFVELLDNAFEASERDNVEISRLVRNDQAIVAIKNSISEVQLPDKQCYEPFHTTKSGHCGLGLPIALRYGSLNGGEVALTRAGLAATATVKLPIVNKGKSNLKIERE